MFPAWILTMGKPRRSRQPEVVHDKESGWYTTRLSMDLPYQGACAKCGKVTRDHVDKLVRGFYEQSVRFWCKGCRA